MSMRFVSKHFLELSFACQDPPKIRKKTSIYWSPIVLVINSDFIRCLVSHGFLYLPIFLHVSSELRLCPIREIILASC